MRLDVNPILHLPGSRIPFETSLDFSELQFGGTAPAPHPITVRGEVRNAAGALMLQAEVETELELICDRCAQTFVQPFSLSIDTLLATELSGEESDDIVLLEGTELDVDELVRTAFILGMDTKHLCREDCKGLCFGCGANLNEEACRCKKEIDPRLSALQQLLDQDKT
jgi:uncharacterized protein